MRNMVVRALCALELCTQKNPGRHARLCNIRSFVGPEKKEKKGNTKTENL